MRKVMNLVMALSVLAFICMTSITASAGNVIKSKVTYGTSAVYLRFTPNDENVVYYTTDGTKPTTSSTKYTKKITAKKQILVRAIEVNKNGKTVATLRKTIKPRCAAPKLSQESYSTYVMVHVKRADNTEYYYTTDGSKPTDESNRLYGEYIKVEENCIVNVIAVKGSFKNSNTASVSVTGILGDDKFVDEVLRLVNIEREKNGLSALIMTDELNSAASVRANEISRSFSHTRPDGSSCFTALSEISYWSAGENIAWGQVSPEEVMNAWMNSPGHRANILNSSFSKIGIGFYRGNSLYSTYWVQMFVG